MDRMERNQRVFDLAEALDKASNAMIELAAVSPGACDKLSEEIYKWQKQEGPPNKKMEYVDRRDLRVGGKLRRRALRLLAPIQRNLDQVKEVLDDAIDELQARA